MKTEQFVTELKRIPKSPKMAVEFQDKKVLSDVINHVKTLSNTERNVAFNFMRLTFFREFISELGYLPSKLIINAVDACSASIRTMKEIDESSSYNVDLLFYHIRKIGEGIALALHLETTNKNEIEIKAYSEHPFVTSLAPQATPGDCFLFNVMFYATGKAPFKDIPISPVVTHYFNKFKSVKSDDETLENYLSFSLNRTVEDIFGKPNPLFPRVSQIPKSGNFVIPCLIIFSLVVVFFLISGQF